MRLPLLVLLLAPAAWGQSGRPAAEAEALLAAGDSSAAYRVVRDGLGDAPDDAALRHLKLALELRGHGRLVQALPRPAKQAHFVGSARRLLQRAPADTLALRVLAEDHVWTALNWHDRAALGHIKTIYGRFVSEEEVNARQGRGRFSTSHRQAMAPDLDRSGRARDAHEEATALLDRWFAVDPGAARAHQLAASLAVVTENWAGLDALAGRFRAASDHVGADLHTGLARYRLGDAAGAEAAFDRAFARMTPAQRARYDNVRMLLPLGRRAAYDADPEAVADSFWTASDPRFLTEANERRAEHRARVVEADLLFGLAAGDLFTDVPRRGAETDQGQIWVRYGRPSESIRFVSDDDATPVYEFNLLHGVWDYPDFQFVFDDPERDGQFRTYSPPAFAFSATRSAVHDDFVAQDAQMQRDDPQRTQVAPETALDVPMLASRFRSPDGGTDVVVGFGVPVGGAEVPVRTGVFALAGGVLSRVVDDRDELADGRVLRSGGEPVWSGAATVRLPGAGEVRVEVEGAGGTARGTATEAVEPLPGGFGVSDLLLALSVDDDGRGLVVRDGLGIVPAPRAAFATADPVYVVLEVYGLGLEDGRTRTTVEATLRPQARRGGLLGRVFGRGQGPGVSVRTEASGSTPDELVSFFVDVRDQDPGRYTLSVTVADETTGATASAEREVVLE